MEAPLIMFSVLAFVAFLIWNRTRDGIERRRLELDAQSRMLERIGPGEALTDFLKTDEGKRFVRLLASSEREPSGTSDVRKSVFVLTTLGLIAVFGGIFFINGVMIPNVVSEDPQIPSGLVLLVATPAFLLTGGGAGALIAAWIMHRSSRKAAAVEAGADRGPAD